MIAAASWRVGGHESWLSAAAPDGADQEPGSGSNHERRQGLVSYDLFDRSFGISSPCLSVLDVVGSSRPGSMDSLSRTTGCRVPDIPETFEYFTGRLTQRGSDFSGAVHDGRFYAIDAVRAVLHSRLAMAGLGEGVAIFSGGSRHHSFLSLKSKRNCIRKLRRHALAFQSDFTLSAPSSRCTTKFGAAQRVRGRTFHAKGSMEGPGRDISCSKTTNPGDVFGRGWVAGRRSDAGKDCVAAGRRAVIRAGQQSLHRQFSRFRSAPGFVFPASTGLRVVCDLMFAELAMNPSGVWGQSLTIA
jgi:hypothetical protein